MQKLNSLRQIETGMYICSISLSPDGKSIATGGQSYAQYISVGGGVLQIWNIENHAQEQLYLIFNETIDAICYSHCGQYLVAGSGDGTLRIFTSRTLQQYGQTMTNRANVVEVLITKGSKQIISAGYQNEFRIWRFHNQKQIIHHQSKSLCKMAISPKGSLIVISSNSGSIQFRDYKFHKSIRKLQIRISSSSLRFSKDGELLATSTYQYIDIVNVAKGVRISQLTSELRIKPVEFSPKKNIILSSGSDRAIRIWNYSTGEHIRKIEFTKTVAWIKFSENNEFLLNQLDSDIIQIQKASQFI